MPGRSPPANRASATPPTAVTERPDGPPTAPCRLITVGHLLAEASFSAPRRRLATTRGRPLAVRCRVGHLPSGHRGSTRPGRRGGGAVPCPGARVRGRVRRGGRVLRRVRLPDHPAAADRTGPHRHDLAVELLGPAGPPPAPGVGARAGGHGGALAVDARPARPTLGGDGCAGVCGVRQQLRVRPPPRRLLRRPARRGAAVAVAALLVVGGRGAVLPRVAVDAVRRYPPTAPVPPAAADRHPRRGGRLAAGVDLAHRRAPDVGVLPLAGAHGRAAGRGGARRGRPGLPRRRRPVARRARMVRAVRGLGGGAPLRRVDGVPRLGGAAAGARDGARVDRRRRRRARRRAGRRAAPPRGAVDRAPVVHDLPLALAGARALRSAVRPAVARPAPRRGRLVGRPRRRHHRLHRRPGAAPPLARRSPRPRAGARRCAVLARPRCRRTGAGHRPGARFRGRRRGPRARRLGPGPVDRHHRRADDDCGRGGAGDDGCGIRHAGVARRPRRERPLGRWWRRTSGCSPKASPSTTCRPT